MKEYKEGDFFEYESKLYKVIRGRCDDCCFYNKVTNCDAITCSLKLGLRFRHTTSQERQEYYADITNTINLNELVKEKIAASKEILEQTKKSLINEMADEIKEDIIKILIEELRWNI